MGTRTTAFATGETLTAADLNAWAGPANAWTPQVDQGATTDIAKTVDTTGTTYWQFGKHVSGRFDLTITGTGTAGAAVVVSLPTARVGGAYQGVGHGMFYDASANMFYPFIVLLRSIDASIEFIRCDAGNGRIGSDPNVALANGDLLTGYFEYEAS
jgi:hypothetical protein